MQLEGEMVGVGQEDYLPSKVCIPDSIKMAFPFYGEIMSFVKSGICPGVLKE